MSMSLMSKKISGPLNPGDDDDTAKLFFTSGANGDTEITINMLPILIAIMGFLMCKFIINKTKYFGLRQVDERELRRVLRES